MRHFLKDQKICFYGENEERLGEIGRNEHIWPKMVKKAQKVKFEHFSQKKICFYGENEEHL